jgi:micrococcal nuclease
MKEQLYNYRAIVTKVYDGDTYTVDIDLGLNVWMHDAKLRLARINTPEVKGEQKEKGLKSRDFIRGLLEGKEILIQTIKDSKEKYGRYLAEVWIEDEKGNLQNVNDLLVKQGLAEYKTY